MNAVLIGDFNTRVGGEISQGKTNETQNRVVGWEKEREKEVERSERGTPPALS